MEDLAVLDAVEAPRRLLHRSPPSPAICEICNVLRLFPLPFTGNPHARRTRGAGGCLERARRNAGNRCARVHELIERNGGAFVLVSMSPELKQDRAALPASCSRRASNCRLMRWSSMAMPQPSVRAFSGLPPRPRHQHKSLRTALSRPLRGRWLPKHVASLDAPHVFFSRAYEQNSTTS